MQVLFQFSIFFLVSIKAFDTFNQIRFAGSPWPLPQLWRSSRIQFQLKSDQLHIVSNAGNCDVLKEAIKRYQNIFFLSSADFQLDRTKSNAHRLDGEAETSRLNRQSLGSNKTPILKELQITVDRPDLCLYPQAGDNESYRLEIGRPTNLPSTDRSNSFRLNATARIKSVSIWGALRALETFAQLIQVNVKQKQLLVNATRVVDWPAFEHRGIRVDSSSHYIPLRTLFAFLDAMETNKLNVLHWSVGGGSLSYPLETKSLPFLWQLGSFSSKHVYHKSDVFELVERARMRGIRVVPELALTGNAVALQRSLPNLIVCCSNDQHSKDDESNDDEPINNHIRANAFESDTDEHSNGISVSDREDERLPSLTLTNKVFRDAKRRKKRSFALTASTLYAAESGLEANRPNNSTSIRSVRSSNLSDDPSLSPLFSPTSSSSSSSTSSSSSSSSSSASSPASNTWSVNECVLDPTRNGSFRLVQRILSEWRSQFVDEHVHVGLRSIRSDCWQQKPSVRRLMHALGLRSSLDLNRQFVQRTIQKATSIGFKSIVWQDAFEQTLQLNPNVTVQLWKGRDLMEEHDSESPSAESNQEYWQQMAQTLAKNGFEMILSSCWQLNGNMNENAESQWMSMYDCDPSSFTDNEVDKKMMKGGEMIVWGDTVDATNLLSLTWPKASAMAERLWTNPTGPTSRVRVLDRLQEQRCRLLLRGIPAAPITPGYCGSFEWDMQ